MDLDQAIGQGHYAKKQILCKDWLISWSHTARFELGLQLAEQFARRRVLDHGCGDGTFLAMLMTGSAAPAEAVGSEIKADLVEDCRTRLGELPNLRFVYTNELDAPEHTGAYDAVFCMEVLEHVMDLEQELDRFHRLLSPTGKLLVSVPVETGLPLVVKQVVRRIAGWRGLGDYPGSDPYTWGESLRSVFAGGRQHILRPVHGDEGQARWHDHKGFNWMALRSRIARKFEIEETFSSPLRWLPPHLASQVWFVARKTQ